MNYQERTIVRVPIKYLSNNSTAVRLLLIVNKNEALEVYDGCNLTKNEDNKKLQGKRKSRFDWNIKLPKDNLNNLIYDSYVKLNEVYELNDNIILEAIGVVTEEYLNDLIYTQNVLLKTGTLPNIERQPIEN